MIDAAAPSRPLALTLLLATCLATQPASGQDCRRGPVFVDGFERGDTSAWSEPPPVPYAHVVPADVGTRLGVGVVAPVPTLAYTGPTTLTSPAVLENVVVDGCLRIAADHVTLRNVIVNCDGLYPIKIENGSRHVVIEYSRIACGSDSKIFYVQNGAPHGRIYRNEATGCQDLFFLEGDLDGFEVVENYLHSLVGLPDAHADGFQIGEFSTTTGRVLVRGNYIDPNNATIGKNDIVFGTNSSSVDLYFEDNYVERWGHYTLRCGGAGTTCTVRHNVFSQAFANVEQRVLLANSPAPSAPAAFCCNRYASGALFEEFFGATDLVLGASHVTAGCPAIAP